MVRSLALVSAAALGVAAFAACEVTEVGSYPCPDAMDCSGKPPAHVGTGSSTVGGACQTNSDCSTGTCITVPLLAALGVDTSHIDIPNGMCSQPYCTSNVDCGDGGVCMNGAAFGNSSVTLCLRGCQNVTQCRWQEGYSCWAKDPSTQPLVCLPLSVIAATYCPTGCP